MTFQNNLAITLVGMMAAVALLFNIKKQSFEGFGLLNLKPVVSREVHLQCKNDAGQNTGRNNFSVSGNYQASLSPRFSNVGYGSNIRYNLPSQQNLAVPPTPLGYKSVVDNVAIENYQPSCDFNRLSIANSQPPRSTQCTIGQSNICSQEPTRYAAMGAPASVQDMLPVTDMRTIACTAGMQSVDQQNAMMSSVQQRGLNDPGCHIKVDSERSGDCQMQPVMYDRLIYANGRSRQKEGSDWIRGDLPIVPVLPESNPNSQVWMRPSARPSLDLNQGAMNIIGGYDNTTNNQLRSLMETATSGTLGTFGGVAINNQRSTVCGPSSDIVVTSFA